MSSDDDDDDDDKDANKICGRIKNHKMITKVFL